MENTATSVIDILCLHLKPGALAAFDKLYRELSLPMLKRWNVDVLAFGPSLHGEDCYWVIRHYLDLADRQQIQDAYYGSDEWKEGLREAIMALIDNYTTAVIPANDTLIAGYKMVNSINEKNEK